MKTITLSQACRFARIPSPVTADDLDKTFYNLWARGIRHNLVGEPIWKDWQHRRHAAIHKSVQDAIKRSKSFCD